jgi:spore maturation protein CgeB
LLEGIKNQISIFGNRWEKNYSVISSELKSRITNRTVWGDELIELMRKSKIVLNITNSNFYCVETGLNLRIFEALAAGCFLLTDYNDELADLFLIGEEIEAFSSLSELQYKVDFYLNNPEARSRIAAAGKKKFYELYTWDLRVKEFAELAGFELQTLKKRNQE